MVRKIFIDPHSHGEIALYVRYRVEICVVCMCFFSVGGTITVESRICDK